MWGGNKGEAAGGRGLRQQKGSSKEKGIGYCDLLLRFTKIKNKLINQIKINNKNNKSMQK